MLLLSHIRRATACYIRFEVQLLDQAFDIKIRFKHRALFVVCVLSVECYLIAGQIMLREIGLTVAERVGEMLQVDCVDRTIDAHVHYQLEWINR